MSRPILSATLLAAALLPAVHAAAQAQDAAALRERTLAASCAQCHGSDGRAAPGSTIPGLAAMPAAYLVEQMQAFKTGTRPGTVMPQLAKGYSDAQIAQIAGYFSRVGAKP